MNFSQLPKVELHLHLDCSLSYKVVQQLDPSISYEKYLDEFVAPGKCHDLADYIKRAAKGFELMQTEEQLRMVTLDLFDQLQADHVIYAEIRFAPLQHIYKGLTAEKVVEIVNATTKEGIEKTGIEAGVILCTLRHFTEVQSMETVKLVDQFKGSTVVGFDIAADEAGFPIDNHVAAFEWAQKSGIACTAHAGEARGADSVWETLKHFAPRRIGHGVRSAEDEQLLNHLKTHDIHLEVCPTSNVQTNVFDTIHDHSGNLIYEKGISMSLNTDGRTVSNVDLAHEYEVMRKEFDWTLAHFKRCNLEAIRHAFTTEEVKTKLIEQIEAAYSH